nr:hypothetical protein [uncultured Undibacterium sp.]
MSFQDIPKYLSYRLLAVTILCFATLLISSCATNNVKEKRETQISFKEKQEAPVSLELLKNALGKAIDGAEISLIKKAAVTPPEIEHFDKEEATYFEWKNLGIELLFERTKLKTVFLYSDKSKEHSAYLGNLPHGLLFSDKRADVERKLGVPDLIVETTVIDFWVKYEKLKLVITYKTLDPNDMNASIGQLAIQ